MRLIKKLSMTLILSALILPTLSFSETTHKSPKPMWCNKEVGYSCLRVKRHQSWHSLWPDEDQRGIVMRINRMNVSLYPGVILTVPDDLMTGELLNYSPFEKNIPALQEKLLIFDPKKHAFAAYDADGALVKWGPAVGGGSWCPDVGRGCHTKVGHFRIYSRGSRDCVSTKYPVPDGGAKMPYCMYFNGGQGFHGSYGGLARKNASHGCVRLFVDDAEWLRYDFVDGPDESNNYRGTKVEVLPYN